MNVQVNTADELDTLSTKLREMITSVNELSTAVDSFKFVKASDFEKISGWSKATVYALFNRPDFPSCDYGKEKVVEIHALIKYFSVPRRR